MKYHKSWHKGDERNLVTLFTTSLKKHLTTKGIIEIDQDNPYRILKSSYDFRILSKDYLCICEAKKVYGREKHKLSDLQEMAKFLYPTHNVLHIELVFTLKNKKDRTLTNILWQFNQKFKTNKAAFSYFNSDNLINANEFIIEEMFFYASKKFLKQIKEINK